MIEVGPRQAAELLVEIHGADARQVAIDHAAAAGTAGDDAGARSWAQIADAIALLLGTRH